MATQTATSDGYAYKGLPLSPTIIESLALELFRGKIVERQVIIEEVQRIHLSRGGLKAKADVARAVSFALKKMLEKALVENPTVGHWRFASENGTQASVASLEEYVLPDSADRSLISPDLSTLPEPDADVVLGEGPGSVYLYYLPTYRLRTEEHNENTWPCKIGRTERDPLSRVLSQAGTALPETPHIALIVRTPFALAWESAIHGVLTLRGRRIEDSPGSEWFLTSPSEVLLLVNAFKPELNEVKESCATNADDTT
jgi:hypothetical protein